MPIEITVSEEQGVTIFSVAGSVNGITAVPLGEHFQRALKRGKSRFVLDLTQTDYMSSAGLREILSALKQAKSEKGNLVLVNPAAGVMELLDMSGLMNYLDIFTTQAEAVQSFV